MATHTLDFERPLLELERQIEEMKRVAGETAVDVSKELAPLEKKLAELRAEIYKNLTPMQRVQVARHPKRPYTLDYLSTVFTDFVELHGDRLFRDDPAIVAGWARLDGTSVMVIGHQKGRDTKENLQRNFGMAHPEGYRKALRLMHLAEQFRAPVITLVDTPGAYPGLGAEERGQAEAIARNLVEMATLRTPILTAVIGEGGSGGALAVGLADRVVMLENSVYSVISPEGCAAILWKDASQRERAAEPLALHEAVIVEVERGEDLGRVSALGPVAAKKCGAGCGGCSLAAPPPPVTHRILRRASAGDAAIATALERDEADVRRTVMDRVRHHSLPMKVSDAEWQWDKKKLTVYFTAEQRVDFRALVRDLASLFRTRIELRQIGARDEAKRLDGVGRCGRQYCCSSWLPELRPVSLSLAKDQHLSLNPSQISGGCGRLLCCLRYEHDFYVQTRKRFPKEGRILRTAAGAERVLAVDIFRETVTVRLEGGGDTRVVTLEKLTAEMARVEPPVA